MEVSDEEHESASEALLGMGGPIPPTQLSTDVCTEHACPPSLPSILAATTSTNTHIDTPRRVGVCSATSSQPMSVCGGSVQQPRAAKGVRVGHKFGHKNYSEVETTKLFRYRGRDGSNRANHWTLNCVCYNNWTSAEGVPTRDELMLKQKFDRIANTDNSTGNPTCSAKVARAKRIARSVRARARALTLGGDID